MQKTQNYNLNKPELTDPVRVDDFNENAEIIDAALASLGGDHVYVGSYVGDGATSRTIQLPWEPKFAVILGHYSSSNGMLELLTQEVDFYSILDGWKSNPTNNMQLRGSTFVVQHASYNNINGKTVYYALFR